eukprot:TRINITY_DN12652_c0_g1_i1.p1 TRINITY_DN12652_c0_g1~~TRINITY_DN12652_c0_g1_i1.p1  ORF type:complete len:487 (+),score=130.90 TRINITY_DN12652_c0_g1_i1:59-1519(+)
MEEPQRYVRTLSERDVERDGEEEFKEPSSTFATCVAREMREQLVQQEDPSTNCFDKSVRFVDNPVCGPVPVSELSAEKLLQFQVLKKHLHLSDEEDHDVHDDHPFYVADLSRLRRQFDLWVRTLPKIEPFYAVKCNPCPMVIQVLAELGTSFDCASKEEIELVLKFGVSPDRIIFANPCKPSSHLLYAKKVGVKMMTFDNGDELRKIKKFYPEAETVIRILADDSQSVCQLGLKFGAPADNISSLLKLTRALGLKLVGVSFHVGSGCRDASTFEDAVCRARQVFDEAAELGFELSLLDVGGGFPGTDHLLNGEVTFAEIAGALNPAIESNFCSKIRVIAEPGRFFAAGMFTLATQIVSMRTLQSSKAEPAQENVMYYINDGVYGSFNCLIFDHAVVESRILLKNGEVRSWENKGYLPTVDGPLIKSSIWGPTCDSMDCVSRDELLPKLSVADWLAFDSMGAYTKSAASNFNGFGRFQVFYCDAKMN